MSKQRIEDCYFEHNSTIFSEMLGEDQEYLRLKKSQKEQLRKPCRALSAKKRGINISP